MLQQKPSPRLIVPAGPINQLVSMLDSPAEPCAGDELAARLLGAPPPPPSGGPTLASSGPPEAATAAAAAAQLARSLASLHRCFRSLPPAMRDHVLHVAVSGKIFEV